MLHDEKNILIMNIAACALLSDGKKVIFETEADRDVAAVAEFCSNLGAKVSVAKKKISVQRRKNSENSYMTCRECSDFTLHFLVGIAALSSGTTEFSCGKKSLTRISKTELKLLKEYGCFISETENGFVIASMYSDARLTFPYGTDEAFICGLFIGSALFGMDQSFFFSPENISSDCKELLTDLFYKNGMRVYFTEEGAYIISAR